jgi:hypothetical protein
MNQMLWTSLFFFFFSQYNIRLGILSQNLTQEVLFAKTPHHEKIPDLSLSIFYRPALAKNNMIRHRNGKGCCRGKY